MRGRRSGLDPGHGELEVAEERRLAPERVDCGADVVREARQRQLLGADTAADRLRGLVDRYLPTGTSHRDRRSQPVGAGADHERCPAHPLRY